MFSFSLSNLVFNSRDSITLTPSTTLVIVGPNSSGKSTVLREIASYAAMSKGQPNVNPMKVLSEISYIAEGSVGEYFSWLRANGPLHKGSSVIPYLGGVLQQSLTGNSLIKNQPSQALDGLLKGMSGLRDPLFYNMDTQTRLMDSQPCEAIAFDAAPTKSFHYLQRDSDLLNEVNKIVRPAFGKELIVNHGGAAQLWLHVGQDPPKATGQDRVSSKYLESLDRLPKLHQEGDGIRSFVSILLVAMCGSHPVLLVDEPEAFLHPSQARRIASALVRSGSLKGRQTIIATHSAEVVLGAIEASRNVLICRLTREGELNVPHVIDNRAIVELWSNPLLRSASTLDGMFHEGVAVCEADSDCQFYGALDAQLGAINDRTNDFHFIHGGGKGAIPSLVAAYKTLFIKTAVIADIDLLRDLNEFRSVIESLKGDFGSIAALHNEVLNALREQGPRIDFDSSVKRFEEMLSTIKSAGKLSPGHKQSMQELLEGAADWSEAKKYGVERLKGGAHSKARQLLAECEVMGLFLVPVGEMESWWRAGPSNKKYWIRKAIQEIAAAPTEFEEARKFVRRVGEYLRS